MYKTRPWLNAAWIVIFIAGCSDSGAKDGDTSEADGKTDSSGGNSDDGAVLFPGGGDSGSADPLEPGVDPETADECGGGTPDGTSAVSVIEQEVECFYSEDDLETPAAAIEQVVEVVDDKTWIHLRLTLDPRFVDNSYGTTAVGWEDRKKGHTFKDLVGSDHAEIMMYDADGTLVLQFKLDYISEDPDSPSGFGTLGVTGGDGKMVEGDAAAILGAATSLDRNLNGCDLSTYTEDSPETDLNYAVSDEDAAWDFRVVYEVWVDATVFGTVGFGHAEIENVHASPSKTAENTVIVIPNDCPPCDPNDEVCDPWESCDPNTEDCGGDRDTDDDTEETDTDTDNDTAVVV